MKGGILILSHVGDATAARIYAAALRKLGESSIRLVSVDEIALAERWQHELSDGNCSTSVVLADGTCLEGNEIALVLNRLRYVSLPHIERFTPGDSEYAAMEMYALVLSWLHSLSCPVLNRPSPRGLGAHDQSFSIWLAIAARSGLPVQGFHLATDARRYPCKGYVLHEAWLSQSQNTVQAGRPVDADIAGRSPVFAFEEVDAPQEPTLAVGDLILGPLANDNAESIRSLQQLTGLDILQLHSGIFGDQSKVMSVTAIPELYSEQQIDALVDLLEEWRLEQDRKP